MFPSTHMGRVVLGLISLSSMTNLSYAAADDNAILITAARYTLSETEAPFATEIHSTSDIQQSGATNLYDYLDQYTSVTVLPSYGNPFVQKLDMRGYGIGDGYQNIVITLNGQRLNNIDMVPQLLSAIALADIDRIEITKGSGSVINGDGAMAGAINIYTKDKSGIRLGSTTGGYGVFTDTLSAGMKADRYALSVSAEQYHQDGYSEPDVGGGKDIADSDNVRLSGKYFPLDSLELRLGLTRTDIDTTYAGSLTRAEFAQNPAQNSGNTYTRQTFADENISAGLTYDVSSKIKVKLDHNSEEKSSEYLAPFTFSADYDYNSSELEVQYLGDKTRLVFGTQAFDGSRLGSDNTTRKENTAYYVQSVTQLNNASLSAGIRNESVDYTYDPTAGLTLADGHSLNAYDLGYNRRLSETLSFFTNLNHAYQAPDIDRFFNFGGTFNAFIAPATVDTLNAGLVRKTEDDKLKVTGFYSKLENEIYYNASTFTNTNIDQSHKYGLEVQNQHRFTSRLKSSVNYTYTRAIIDSEADGGGAFNGKDLPGVSDHSLSVGLVYSADEKNIWRLDHTYRSETYAANDFANNLSQMQPAYQVTNLGYQYKLKDADLFAGIENLFDHANGIQVQDNAIYPVNFQRTWKIGFNVNF